MFKSCLSGVVIQKKSEHLRAKSRFLYNWKRRLHTATKLIVSTQPPPIFGLSRTIGVDASDATAIHRLKWLCVGTCAQPLRSRPNQPHFSDPGMWPEPFNESIDVYDYNCYEVWQNHNNWEYSSISDSEISLKHIYHVSSSLRWLLECLTVHAAFPTASSFGKHMSACRTRIL